MKIQAEDERRCLCLEEAAKDVGVCRKTLKREIEAGRLRAFRVGRQYRIRSAELEAYMKRAELRFAGGAQA
ncbi:MAG TPA: excisionase family DNA-binding protein [Planctomycetota bacterium]|jgi:excisionase family DNA binding protein